MIIKLDQAVELIKSGDVVAFPTETVYGLGADAFNIQAIKKTFELKGRPSDNPLIVHVSNQQQVDSVAEQLPEEFEKLKQAFWPGPLTMILPKSDRVPDLVTGGLNTVAVRMPDHPIALKLIRQTGPLTAPSANKSGKPSPTKPEHLDQDYKEGIPILDGGSSEIGLESTILDLTISPPEILRPGAITAHQIENVTGSTVTDFRNRSLSDTEPVKSPGLKYTHYKPAATVKWMKRIPATLNQHTIYIVHSKKNWPDHPQIFSYKKNYARLARDLYDVFRTADHLGYSDIEIEQLPDAESDRMIHALLNRITKAVGTDE
ncbi:L-threonylcarbamoyladenylate synthase [Rhodohalobacter halophilus]|uniref:L-threonylcarbamoyladenylate synthase n=1 Tax=Rhodohalobacter halophilus TaxID=1812810 RepID=UPI00083F540E|nr:L-threonylcarbamoyladenylate synthase [Rhodohalobacter halophilus]